MTPDALISLSTLGASIILSLAFLLAVYRVVVGPTLPDRIIALDTLVGIAIGFIAVIAIRTGFDLYVDIAIALCLVGFLATVAFARFILSRRPEEGQRAKQILDGTDVLPASSSGTPRKPKRKNVKGAKK
ncbi:cation:proton antiporter [Agrobacterium sp. rho-8.1]|jgi:multicomponent Na+:H+ antiporter subunit F|nr:cation:proton antiporter [Agrobacterium sp. rho-8.1]